MEEVAKISLCNLNSSLVVVIEEMILLYEYYIGSARHGKWYRELVFSFQCKSIVSSPQHALIEHSNSFIAYIH